VTLPLVFRHGAAETVFIIALAVWVAFEAVMRVVQRMRATDPSDDLSFLVLVPCVAGSVIAAEILGRRGRFLWPGGLGWPFVVGMVLIVAGLGLRAWSIASLGRFFQYRITVQSGHQVVTKGPYRYVRHPSYTGIALILIGIALACDDVWALPVVAVLGGVGLYVRIRAEERQLNQALGEDYERFAAGRKRLVPGVW
jgi:protein-S-isoprenylcysteine O-methyltransferase Ste14